MSDRLAAYDTKQETISSIVMLYLDMLERGEVEDLFEDEGGGED